MQFPISTRDLLCFQIRVNAVNPGATITEMVDDTLNSDDGRKLMERTSLGRFAGGRQQLLALN